MATADGFTDTQSQWPYGNGQWRQPAELGVAQSHLTLSNNAIAVELWLPTLAHPCQYGGLVSDGQLDNGGRFHLSRGLVNAGVVGCEMEPPAICSCGSNYTGGGVL
jgi:hypothetical protein